MNGMRFRVLGRLQIFDGQTWSGVRAKQQRTVPAPPPNCTAGGPRRRSITPGRRRSSTATSVTVRCRRALEITEEAKRKRDKRQTIARQ